MSHQIKFIMVGGFLGAGKTTTLSRLAKYYSGQGLKVGVVTNDQAADLVDTNALRSQGLNVGEVAGACFCCHFDALMETIEELGSNARPDVILAEPVGSCTDLVATVIQPIKRLFDAEFSIHPYTVLMKPSHGRKILKNDKGSGFSPKAAYILKKQLEEADLILVNRIDELSVEDVDELIQLIGEHFPGTPVLKTSALTGEGFEALTAFLEQEGDFGSKILDIDYDIYAEGEAELGWLNSSVRISSETSFSLDQLLMDVISQLQTSFKAKGVETAHLKTIGLWEGFFGVANLVSNDSQPTLSLSSDCTVNEVDLIVNARVACDPEALAGQVKSVLQNCAKERSANLEFRQTQSFRPGRPVPTHRYAAPQ
ncbi:MAG: cobalamin biosynthesis protein P47K [Planctomycetes bacterium]|nr:cobalamin biosynthesis protein P47K [Planctomycetota bacterium]MCH9726033.1 cobalamin biosynthesis protein P47K [Planctomycetota bacterium]MCH9777185.1 cobalamin biosynthesis protein P47K [Planctomycetota bacterium]MCH9790983.1 cobalamin biosynthesis protein P47K [Planctomycetota bacterium]